MARAHTHAHISARATSAARTAGKSGFNINLDDEEKFEKIFTVLGEFERQPGEDDDTFTTRLLAGEQLNIDANFVPKEGVLNLNVNPLAEDGDTKELWKICHACGYDGTVDRPECRAHRPGVVDAGITPPPPPPPSTAAQS